MTITSLLNIFDQLISMAESCGGVCFTQLCCMVILSTYISQGSVATRLRCNGIFNSFFAQNLLPTLLVKNLKIC